MTLAKTENVAKFWNWLPKHAFFFQLIFFLNQLRFFAIGFVNMHSISSKIVKFHTFFATSCLKIKFNCGRFFKTCVFFFFLIGYANMQLFHLKLAKFGPFTNWLS